MTRLRALITVALIQGAPAFAAGDGEPRFFLPKGVQASWLVKPEQDLPPDCRFDVDSKGRAYLLVHPRILRLPTGSALPLKEDVRDLLLTSSDKLYLLSDRAAGPAELKGPDEEERTWARVKEKLLLPGAGWRLAEGGSQGVLAYGYNPDTQRYEAYRLRDRRKLLESEERIQALCADGGSLVAALPGRLLRFSEGSKPKEVSSGGATQLVQVPGLGLAAAHPQGLTLIRAGRKPVPILEAAFPKIRARGGDLYVMLREGGILKLSGLAALKELP